MGAAVEVDRGQHYSGMYTRLVINRVRSVLGEQGVVDCLGGCGQELRLAALGDDGSWSSYENFRSLLESAARCLGSVDALHGVATTAILELASMPAITDALLAMGSPGAVMALSESAMGTSGLEVRRVEQVAPTVWDLGFRLPEGFEPFEELCVFHTATTTLLPRSFGCSNVRAEELSCQRRGDGWCTVRLSWDEDGGDTQRAEFLARRLALVERRLAEFAETVAGVVSTDDLPSVLQGVLAAAASAVPAPGFILALDPLPWDARLIYASGLSREDAVGIAASDAISNLVVEIRSGRRRHGRLIAVGATGILTLPSMQGLLQGYAQLAATALDGAIAVEEARRQATTSRLLLGLAMRLARTGSLKELGDRVVEILPELIDCDRAVFAVVDGPMAVVVGAYGYTSPHHHDIVRGARLPLVQPPVTGILYLADGPIDAGAQAFLGSTHSEGCVVVPIIVNDEVLAYIAADVTRDGARLRPSPELEERLNGLAALVSTAMHNSLLLQRISYQAEHDALTGLPNRNVLIEQLMGSTEAAASVLFVDLDDFKDVNDGLGHQVGDLVLCQVADRLRSAVRDGDVVARLGGDEFAVVVCDSKPGAGEQMAGRVIDLFAEPFDVDGRRVAVSASVGLADAGAAPEDLLHSADIAMYRAKAAGKGRMAVFEPGMDHASGERLTLHADLADAVSGGQLRVLYQPVVDIADGTVSGAEALVRWQHPTLGLLNPDRFIGLAEETGLIGGIGTWVLHQACQQALTWPDHLTIAVNISPRELDDPGIVTEVIRVLGATGLCPERLILEITENVFANDMDAVVPRLQALRSAGVRIAIDDFGTGYSALGVLVTLPVDILKIDRVFVSRMLERPSADLVQVLIDMGRTLGLAVVAEGIEQAAQALALRDRGCQLGQGFLYSPAVGAADFGHFVDHPVRAGVNVATAAQ